MVEGAVTDNTKLHVSSEGNDFSHILKLGPNEILYTPKEGKIVFQMEPEQRRPHSRKDHGTVESGVCSMLPSGDEKPRRTMRQSCLLAPSLPPTVLAF